MSNSSPTPLIEAAVAAFGAPTSMRSAEPTERQVKVLAAAWKVAPAKYKESFCSYLLECVARHPEYAPRLFKAMPYLDWSFGRGVLPFWAEAIMGVPSWTPNSIVPSGTSNSLARPAYVPHDAQPAFWEAWVNSQAEPIDPNMLTSLLDPYEPHPRTLSGKRALWLSKCFMPFIEANLDRPEFRDSVVEKAFIPLAASQGNLTTPVNNPVSNSMAGYLAAALSRAWIVDYVAGRSPAWENWMFEQSKVIWPNFSHRIDSKDKNSAPQGRAWRPGMRAPHLYGLPEVFLQRVLTVENRRAQKIVDLDDAHLTAIQIGVARSLEFRAGPDGNSVWLPVARVMRTMSKDNTELRAFIDNQLLKMEVGRVRKALINPEAQEKDMKRARPLF